MIGVTMMMLITMMMMMMMMMLMTIMMAMLMMIPMLKYDTDAVSCGPWILKECHSSATCRLPGGSSILWWKGNTRQLKIRPRDYQRVEDYIIWTRSGSRLNDLWESLSGRHMGVIWRSWKRERGIGRGRWGGRENERERDMQADREI